MHWTNRHYLIISEVRFINCCFSLCGVKKSRFARHLIFVFLLYDVINFRQSGQGYFLLIKTRFWEQTYADIDALTMAELNKAVEEVKITEKYTNPTILKLERQVQIVVAQIPYLFAKCDDQAVYIKALRISDGMPVL